MDTDQIQNVLICVISVDLWLPFPPDACASKPLC